MQKEKNVQKKNIWIGVVSFLIVAAFVAILIVPQSREVFRACTEKLPLVMGFVKFALLATIGELIALRLNKKAWVLPSYLPWRMFIWGFIGMAIALVFKVFYSGTAYILELGIFPGHGVGFLQAFFTSVIMNLTFAPTMMMFHRLMDNYFDMRHTGQRKMGVQGVVAYTDWQTFVRFVLLKTVPIFWIPAHTVTFLLPAEYQTIMAAFLSIALGIILSMKKKRPDHPEDEQSAETLL